jgi:predicted DNA-binding antitoxin AbrB/MazE fold protein
MKTIPAVYENGVFRPTVPVSLPENCEVEITIRASQPEGGTTTLSRLADIARLFPHDSALPDDLAVQHDHYLYGTPKRP